MNRFVESTFLYIELKGNDFLYSMVYKNILFSEVLNLKGEKFLNFDTDTFVTLLLKLSFRVQMSQDSEKATRHSRTFSQRNAAAAVRICVDG